MEPKKAPRRTSRGHVHAEAFCLMWYECKDCGARECIWNSRDGVTPFGMGCESCGGHNKMHVSWGDDKYAPKHKLNHDQRYWRDGTPDEAEAIMRRRINLGRKQGLACDVAKELKLIAMARDEGSEHAEFQKGWPVISVHSVLDSTPSGGTEHE